MGRGVSSGIRAESSSRQSKYSGLLGQTILPSLTSRSKLCVPSPDPKLVLTNLPVTSLQMAKSNRNTRRTVNETPEGSASNVARNEAGTEEARNAAQNAANLNNAAAAGAAAGVAAAPVGLEAVLAMLAQVLARLPAAVAPPVAAPVAEEAENVVPDREEVHVVRNPSYLKVMDHMQKLGTKFFLGGSKPKEADQWIDRIGQNFKSIRCPLAYKKDIAVHYLDGDAHT